MQVGADRVRLPLSGPRVRSIVEAVLRGERRAAAVAVTFVGPTAMRRLHRKWKGGDRATDVLAFAWQSPGAGLTGDIYVCAAVARRQAVEFGVPWRQEVARLVINGTLHLLGYDHADGAGRSRSAMWRRQERYVKALA